MVEWALEVFRLARREGLYNTFVSNGYMTEEVLRALAEAGLDAINVDVKGDGEAVRRHCGADVEKVWRNVALSRRLGLHVEVVNLIIPGVNDREDQLLPLIRRHPCTSPPTSPPTASPLPPPPFRCWRGPETWRWGRGWSSPTWGTFPGTGTSTPTAPPAGSSCSGASAWSWWSAG
jgi:hypothetical protein